MPWGVEPVYYLLGDTRLLDTQRAIACMKYEGLDDEVSHLGPKTWPGAPLPEDVCDTYGGGRSAQPGINDTKRHIDVFNGRPIARHVLTAEGSNLVPQKNSYSDDKFKEVTGKFENMCGMESYSFDPRATALLNEARAKAAGENHNAERYTKLQGDLKQLLTVYERKLGEHKYLVHDKIMAVDLFHLPVIRALNEFPDAVPFLKDFTNVERWWKELTDLRMSVDSW